jgi:hypothetical protein
VAATTVESATAVESAKGMATAEMSSAETMAEEMVSPIVAAVVTVVTKPSTANVRPVIRSHDPIPGASAEQKDGGSNY